MVPAAPRYDRRIVAAISLLDDRSQPIAETCRRVGRVASESGLSRPSYVHVRRLLLAERRRQDARSEQRAEVREVALDVVRDLVLGRRVDAYEVADRVQEARKPVGG